MLTSIPKTVSQADYLAALQPLMDLLGVSAAEVGNTALFLVSDLSSGITGETIYVDCGYNIMGV